VLASSPLIPEIIPLSFVIPAKAGIHRATGSALDEWIPAFAGMTKKRDDGKRPGRR
jgi:hypothetical protein